MRLLKQFICFFAVIGIAVSTWANPIPVPRPASMPLEDMYSYLDETDLGELSETFIGNYYFSYIPEDVDQMKYPLPPESNDISVAMGKLPEDWDFTDDIFPFLHEMQVPMDPMKWFYIRELYPTVLPEWPGIPMIAWNGLFPKKAVLSIKYQHNLLKREQGYIYFYALGTGKYHQTYQKEALSFLDISMPIKYNMQRLFLDHTPFAFAETSEKDDSGTIQRIVSISATAQFGPFTKDIIGYIRPRVISRAISFEDKTELEAKLPRQIRLSYKVELDECDTTGPSEIRPSVFALGRRMIVTDQIYFNCCPEYIRMTILVNENQVIFREKAMEKAPCDCFCYYPMKGTAGPFAPGTYQVEIINPFGKKILEKEIVIR